MMLSEIRPRLAQMRRSQAELARYIDLDPSSLTKTLDGGRQLQPHEAAGIERFFGEKLELDDRAPRAMRVRSKTTPARIAVFGYVAFGTQESDAIAWGGDKVLEYLEPPPFWAGNGELVYVRMIGEVMSPRYRSGEIVPVRLNFPPAVGQDCLLELVGDAAIVRTYQGERDGHVYVEQFGREPRTYAIEATKVKAKHAVWRPGMI